MNKNENMTAEKELVKHLELFNQPEYRDIRILMLYKLFSFLYCVCIDSPYVDELYDRLYLEIMTMESEEDRDRMSFILRMLSRVTRNTNYFVKVHNMFRFRSQDDGNELTELTREMKYLYQDSMPDFDQLFITCGHSLEPDDIDMFYVIDDWMEQEDVFGDLSILVWCLEKCVSVIARHADNMYPDVSQDSEYVKVVARTFLNEEHRKLVIDAVNEICETTYGTPENMPNLCFYHETGFLKGVPESVTSEEALNQLRADAVFWTYMHNQYFRELVDLIEDKFSYAHALDDACSKAGITFENCSYFHRADEASGPADACSKNHTDNRTAGLEVW